jgi:type II secretory pathway pseudopilin PulG
VPRSGPGRRCPFTLLEILIVVTLVAIVLALAAPRVGHIPARLRAEHCLSAVRAALDETCLRARATGRSYRLLLVTEEDSSRFVVSEVTEDPLTLPLSPEAAAPAPAAPATGTEQKPGQGGAIVLEVSEYKLPDAVRWDPDSLAQGTAAGDEGPVFLFYKSGEAGGPALAFSVGARHYRLDLDPLTGRVDIRLLAED